MCDMWFFNPVEGGVDVQEYDISRLKKIDGDFFSQEELILLYTGIRVFPLPKALLLQCIHKS